ncbi:MAG: 16S rRNA (adenine(1518)-N(6)/adenine(1519)-N(6))-dimethyltransferase RsmA [Endomicrobia bacterium]|nr:16S rRNA (adenine(1518)-N(6)/adenine(1519)-N(6))-dimethyltransferase RsmA [Endomicrobiia bacterium]MCL2799822.1 16S rRNA (adenine(1518)-N(6)/adenine(1519)-N(6))-dimethyltransferase RsmA [Endomicrobiia bacterium]
MRQKHGQNFLIDNNIANNIVKAADLTNEDNVLEIGPGKGVLTKLIQPQVKHLTAVEIDSVLAQQQRYYFSFHNINNAEVITEDFLKLSTSHFSLSTLPFKVISNLPYNVGTAIIQKILPLDNWTLCVLMLQKEVIQRLAAKPGDKDYGYISIFTQYYADCKILFDVSPKCFNPAPKVVSSVIKLTNKHSTVPDKILFDFIKHAFSQRRKTILNSLSSFSKLDKTQASGLLNTCQIDPMLRPDRISLTDFLNLTNALRLLK